MKHQPKQQTAFLSRFRDSIPGRLATGTLLVQVAWILAGCGKPVETAMPELQPGLAYTNQVVSSGPVSVHVVRVDRSKPTSQLRSVHAGYGAFGLANISDHLRGLPKAVGRPMAAINGDFYQREGAYAGDPRGFQLIDGMLVSAPMGVCLWIDRTGEPHMDDVQSRFQLTWPDGSKVTLGFNEESAPNRLVLFAPSAGAATRTRGGREWILAPEASDTTSGLPIGGRMKLRVTEIRDGGNSPIPSGGFVLSAGPALVRHLPTVNTQQVVEVDLSTSVPMDNAVSGIGGGPMLVRNHRPLRIEIPDDDAYQFKSMKERHPRSAVGWNREYYFFVTVDGRQKESVGMTLEELGKHLAAIGCSEAMNLDGGGSATLWADGRIRNHPSDGSERPIANALVVVRPENPAP